MPSCPHNTQTSSPRYWHPGGLLSTDRNDIITTPQCTAWSCTCVQVLTAMGPWKSYHVRMPVLCIIPIIFWLQRRLRIFDPFSIWKVSTSFWGWTSSDPGLWWMVSISQRFLHSWANWSVSLMISLLCSIGSCLCALSLPMEFSSIWSGNHPQNI